jgi:glycosyltransferase involved in cell wall biosynthesis
MLPKIITDEPNFVRQPPVARAQHTELTVAISSLSLGGAEQIVLDWAMRVWPDWRVHLVVLRDRDREWPVPSFVRVTRLGGKQLIPKLTVVGREIANSGNATIVCHLLARAERDALAAGGAHPVPVLHNAKAGWLEDAASLSGAPHVVAVSEDCARDVAASGSCTGVVSVVRHIPRRRIVDPDARERLRRQWNIPLDAVVIGMVGAVKPQKNYPMALRLLGQLLTRRDVYLVILGGPVNTPIGKPTWQDLVADVHTLEVRHRVAMPGFVPDAAKCLSALDLVLNTSSYEGLSIATLEALVHGLPVVASKVGGQGELSSRNLTLMANDATDMQWLDAIERGLATRSDAPAWADFPAYRQWTLVGLARPFTPGDELLFVTANLNAGGAQRSLVNLALGLKQNIPLSVMVAGVSTATHFWKRLKSGGVPVVSGGHRWSAFAYAEAIVARVCERKIGTVVFWNTDARVKLLVVKALASLPVRFVDVSPGDYLYGEMDDAVEFQELIAFRARDYWKRLDTLVLKYHGMPPREFCGEVRIIPNGVPQPSAVKTDYSIAHSPRIVVNGRIAPSKFIIEIVRAMRLVWQTIPDAQLHLFGTAEHYHRDYADAVLAEVGDEVGRRIVLHGADFEIANRLSRFDALVVLGKHQGCPNAILEAMAAGLPVIANDDGGTREQVVHGQTGLLLAHPSPAHLAQTLTRILSDRFLAAQLGTEGRAHVRKQFPMSTMRKSYQRLLRASV